MLPIKTIKVELLKYNDIIVTFRWGQAQSFDVRSLYSREVSTNLNDSTISDSTLIRSQGR